MIISYRDADGIHAGVRFGFDFIFVSCCTGKMTKM